MTENWSTCSLGNLITLQRGFDLPSRLRKSGHIPIISSAGITDHHDTAMMEGPGVITGRYGTIGEVFYIEDKYWPLNTTLFVRDFKGNHPLFIYYLLQTIDFKSCSGKSGVPGVNRNDVHELTVTKIPYEYQEAIAKALSDMDSLIQSLEQQIIKKQQIKQGAMQSLLNPYDAHGDLKTSWKQTKLGKIAEFINGRAYGLHEWENSGVPVIRLQNLTGRGSEYYYSTLNLPEKQYCNKGDLLFMRSATFGPVIWKGEKAIYHYHIWKIQCIENKADKDFLYYVLDDLTEKLKRTSSSGGTMLHVTKEKMESTEVTIPEVEVQADISSALKEIDSEIGELKLKLSKHQKLKQGMMQNLLTGSVRLV